MTISNINAIPKMTSNNTPSGVVTYSSQHATLVAWKAFDGIVNNSSVWFTPNGTTTGWIQYEFPTAKKIGRYTLVGMDGTDGSVSNPKSWKFEGSNDGVNYTTLDSQSNITSWTIGGKKTFDFINKTHYKMYRLNISSSNGTNYVGTTEIEMFETYDEYMVVKNPTTLQAYSLSDNTLIHLPSTSSKNMILFGVEQNKEVQLDTSFSKKNYVGENVIPLTNGKVISSKVKKSNVIDVKGVKG